MGIAFSFIYGNTDYYYETNENLTLKIGSGKKNNIIIKELNSSNLTIKAESDKLSIIAKPPFRSIGEVSFNKLTPLTEDFSAMIYSTKIVGRYKGTFKLPYNGNVSCGRADTNNIKITFPFVSKNHFTIRCMNGTYSILDLNSTNGVYLNGKRINASRLSSGDIISVFTCRILLKEGTLYFDNVGSSIYLNNIVEERKFQDTPHINLNEKKLKYKLSPRTREQLPKDMIVLSNPPSLGNVSGKYGIGSMGYLTSNAFMIAMSMIGGNFSPAFMLARSAGMIPSVVNMVKSSKMNKKQKAELEKYQAMCVEKYEEYIREQRAKIGQAADIQRRIITQENPDPNECIDIMNNLRKRLWERMPNDSDFLSVRLGMGYEELCVDVKTRSDLNAFHIQSDEMEQLSEQIIEETKYVDNIPTRVSLIKNNTIGIIGNRNDVISLVRNMLIELTVFHTPKDVKLVGIFDKKEQARWAFIRWLPHIWDDNGQFRYLAFDTNRVHSLCEILDDLLKKRRYESTNDNYKSVKTKSPHYVIILGSGEQVFQEPVYTILSSLPENLGVTVIYLFDDIYNLPPDCKYIIDTSKESCAYNRNIYNGRVYFTPDKTIGRKEMDKFARRMSAIEVEEVNAGSDIPSSVNFLKGMGVDSVKQLDVDRRWEHSRRTQSLATPVGMMANNKLFYLDIQDVAEEGHGPHGLIAGTSGSGKSEFLQSWILSMAVNYHPHDVNFVIIDYKGGGMADLLEPLPHVVGKITNIDTDISRILRSLNGEIKRRENLFNQFGVNSIKKYRKAFLSGVIETPLPHLVIVADEFAELKKEEPEFMRDLVSIARVGRSLGIHLVLATQKPGGVVDDQIDSNSRFRICLKVQDVSDSREVLKHPDAARITQAGRAYVRVGEDEIYEQFQSLFSGAVYSDNINKRSISENLVRVVDVNGQKIQTLPKKKKDESLTDELTAVTDELNRVCEYKHIEKLKGPWLPQLPTWLSLDNLCVNNIFDGEKWYQQNKYLRVPIGMYDAPAQQLQDVLFMDFEAQGHFSVYGIPSSGKTTLLETLIYSAGLNYSPKDLKIHILDFNSWTLLEFAKMPHIGEIIRNDEEENLVNFAVNIKKEFERRKALFLKHTVNSLSAYRSIVSKDMPAILIVLDNILPVFNQMEALEEMLYLIASNGASYGIHLVFTANSTVGISYKFTQLIKGSVALQLSDKGEYSTVVGYLGESKPPTVAGQALIKDNPPLFFQTCVCINEKNDLKRHSMLQEKFDNMNKVWKQSNEYEDIKKDEVSVYDPFAGGKISYSDNSENHLSELFKKYTDSSMFPVGIGEDYNIRFVNFSQCFNLILLAVERQKLNSYLKLMTRILSVSEDNDIYIFEGRDSSLKSRESCVKKYLKNGDAVETENALIEIATILNQRMLKMSMSGLTGGSSVEGDKEKRFCLIIEDIASLSDNLSNKGKKILWNIMKKSKGLETVVISAGTKSELETLESGDMLLSASTADSNAIILDGILADFKYFTYDIPTYEQGMTIEDDKAFYMSQGQGEWISVQNDEV